MGIFSDAQGQLTPQSLSNLAEIRTRSGYYSCPHYLQLVRDIIDVLVTCKYKEDQIKNECARVLTRLYDFFQTLKGS